MSPAEQTYTERLEQRVRESREYAELLFTRGRRWRWIAIVGWAVVVALLVLGVP